MQTRYSFGIIPLTLKETGYDAFLVKHVNGGHWGFPKGHAEQGESPKETAERELLEETGMRVLRYLPYPYLVEKYQFMWEGLLIDKSVRFYLAEVSTEFHLQKEELSAGKWLPIKELLNYATFEEEKKLYFALIRSLTQ